MPTPGAVIGGKYEIVRSVGGGGMGMVYEAKHLRLARSVAIKVLQPELQSAEGIARFEREARAAGGLKSPHVVRVFDVDTTSDGLLFMVMELLQGHDLAKEVALRGSIPIGELVEWMRQVFAGLGEAHANGIVHRDLKPANIFLAEEENASGGGKRIAKIVDFGISKLVDPSAKPLTAPHLMLGTPTYMAPEQILAKTIDHRADIWAVGVLLYRLIAGALPFDAKNSTYLACVVADQPIPIEHRCPSLPPALASAIMKSLEKDPEDRWQSIGDLAAAIAPFGITDERAEEDTIRNEKVDDVDTLVDAASSPLAFAATERAITPSVKSDDANREAPARRGGGGGGRERGIIFGALAVLAMISLSLLVWKSGTREKMATPTSRPTEAPASAAGPLVAAPPPSPSLISSAPDVAVSASASPPVVAIRPKPIAPRAPSATFVPSSASSPTKPPPPPAGTDWLPPHL